VAITGGPWTGKSKLADTVTDRLVIHSDAYKDLEWSMASLRVLAEAAGHTDFVAEGVRVAHALRKGLTVDAVVYLTRPKKRLEKPGQASMTKATRTVFDQWHAANRHIPVFFEGARE
jgi:dephospho-CoA kinase